MIADVADGEQLPVLAHDQHRIVADLDDHRAVVRQLLLGGHVGPVLLGLLPRMAADVDALPPGQVPTQVGPGGGRAGPEEAQEDTLGPASSQAGDQGQAVEDHCDGVAGGVGHAQTSLLADGARPVGQTGRGGGKGGDQAERHKRVRRPAAPAAADQVENEGAGPAADGQVGEHGMQGVAEPGAAQPVLQRPLGDGFGDFLGERLGHLVEPFGPAHPLDDLFHATRRHLMLVPAVAATKPRSVARDECSAVGRLPGLRVARPRSGSRALRRAAPRPACRSSSIRPRCDPVITGNESFQGICARRRWC